MTDTFVSDSTINLVLVQFGIVGLTAFMGYFILQFGNMFKRNGNDKAITIMLIGIFILLCVVGNLFEQIAMSEIYLTVFFLNQQVNKDNSSGSCTYEQ